MVSPYYSARRRVLNSRRVVFAKSAYYKDKDAISESQPLFIFCGYWDHMDRLEKSDIFNDLKCFIPAA